MFVHFEDVPCDKDQARKRRKQFDWYKQIPLRILAPYQLNSINELGLNLK